MAPLHVAQINVFRDPRRRACAELLQAWPAMVDIAQAPTKAGIRVSVLQVADRDELIAADGVEYHFLAGGVAAMPGRLAQIDPDVMHLHGLSFAHAIRTLTRAQPQRPLLLQDHADQVPPWWRRPAWRRALSAAAGVAFCSVEQATPFVQSGLLKPDARIFAVPESTSRFRLGNRQLARASTGLHGDPCVLWVGHLNENKDPLTVLAGLSGVAQQCPGLQLWCCFGNAPLLAQVRERIAGDPLLRHRVHLLGSVPHQQIETLMCAADIFVSGSHREGSGFAVIEALACGLAPVITDIPSFRELTGNGAVGKLWRCDDADQLTAALLRQWAERHPQQPSAIRAYFEQRLSLSAIGRTLGRAYHALCRGQSELLA